MAANIRITFLSAVCILALFLMPGQPLKAQSALSDRPLEILNITPSGDDVPAGKKIVFQFNRPVVPVGAMDRKASEIPITIEPVIKGSWRWLNTSTLAYTLDGGASFNYATRYSITVNPGIKTEDGTTLEKPVKQSFITMRPKVVHSWFQTWQSPNRPVMRLTFNQPVTKRSVENYLYMQAGWQKETRVAVKAEPDENDQEVPMFLPLPGENMVLVTPPKKEKPSPPKKSLLEKMFGSISGLFQGEQEKKEDKSSSDLEARRVWLVSPQRDLPGNQSLFLKIEPGLESALGQEKGTGKREVLKFSTFPEFSYKGFVCYDNFREKVFITPGGEQGPDQLCSPTNSVSLLFTSPVLNSELKKNIKITPKIADDETGYNPWDNMQEYSRLNQPYSRSGEYYHYLPLHIKPDQLYNIAIDSGLKDEFSRSLKNPVEITFKTDHMPSGYNLTNPISILEKDIDSEMPVVVTNLERLSVYYTSILSNGKSINHNRDIPMPRKPDTVMKVPVGIRKMLEGSTGVVTGILQSAPYVEKYGDSNIIFGEVTPFQVHVKMGHFNTLAWVTDLKTGEPVKDAKVSIFIDKYRDLFTPSKTITEGITDSDGLVRLAGSDVIDPDNDFLYSYDRDSAILFTKVEKDNDMALLPMDYNFLMESYAASNYTVYSSKRREYGFVDSWGTTAQGVYRAGDTIQYKIYVRNQDNETVVPAPKEKYFLKVYDPMSKTVHEVKDIKLSEFGAFDGEFKVPETGAVGWYRFELSCSFAKNRWQPMRVLVSDFTPSPFKVTADINGKDFLPEDKLEVTTQARLHAGGPYTDASARVTVNLRSRTFSPDNPSAKGFYFNSYNPEKSDMETLLSKDGNLDDKGNLLTDLTLPESEIYYGRLDIESAVRDDRGKYIAGSGSAAYASRDRFVGLRCDSWIFNANEPALVDVIVVDNQGKSIDRESVKIKVEREEKTAAKVKGAGNAYLTQMNTEWVLKQSKKIKSGKDAVPFKFVPKQSGLYRIVATVKDTKGREHSTEITKWVTGRSIVLWDDDNKNGLDIIPEKTDFKVGETAKYLVKNPYPGVKALVTIERYGVLKQWVQTLETGTPVIEFEIEKDFIPGFYLSVVVVSPRVDVPPGDGSVDLGKPAFRMGYVEGTVTDPYKKIITGVKSDKEVYKPGEKVKVTLHAELKDNNKNEPIEFAVAVLDESVLDLLSSGTSYFDPYKGFYQLENLDMRNYSLLMQLVGRQKFEKKGADPAGDGGGDIGLRTVFKFLSYWNPSIKADAEGNADIEFELPDNLTGWRVLAMAVTPGEKMGLGQGSFKVNRPTEIRPVMPNQITQGDRFDAGFSVMNRTGKERDLEITITAEGAVETETGKSKQKLTKTVNVKPYKRVTVLMPVKSKGSGEIRFTASGGDAADRDGTIYNLTVNKMVSLETSATYGTTDKSTISELLKVPEGIRTDTGSLFINLSPTVIGNLEGAFKYLKNYSYTCWEQKITRAVMASHFINLEKYMSPDFEWKDADTISDAMLKFAPNYQAPCGGMTYYVPEDRFVSPYLSAYTAMAFNWLKSRGHDGPASVEERLHEYLLTMLRKNIVPDFYTGGMSSTVRAVALAALSHNNKITLDDLSRYFPHVKEMDTFGKAHFLMAASTIKGAEEMAKDVFRMIIAQSDQTGGKFMINETLDDGYSRILSSGIRTNAAALSAVIAYGSTEEGKKLTSDIPFKMVRYISQTRKQSGRWENTQENVFCMNALVEYSKAYEAVEPDMKLSVLIADKPLGKAEFKKPADAPVTLKRAIDTNDPGLHTKAVINKEGSGRYYYSVGMSYAPLEIRKDNIDAGINIRREYSVEREGKWVLLESPMTINRGELVRIDLYISIPGARNFMVVDDPVPGGLEPVNRDLATSSAVDADKAKSDSDYAHNSWYFHYGSWSWYGMSRWSFYHKELRHNAARFYSEYLPAGNYHLSYTAQAIATGEFMVMPAHSEEMYDPDVFGKSAPGMLAVEEQ